MNSALKISKLAKSSSESRPSQVIKTRRPPFKGPSLCWVPWKCRLMSRFKSQNWFFCFCFCFCVLFLCVSGRMQQSAQQPLLSQVIDFDYDIWSRNTRPVSIVIVVVVLFVLFREKCQRHKLKFNKNVKATFLVWLEAPKCPFCWPRQLQHFDLKCV